jgi:hypothetical protein
LFALGLIVLPVDPNTGVIFTVGRAVGHICSQRTIFGLIVKALDHLVPSLGKRQNSEVANSIEHIVVEWPPQIRHDVDFYVWVLRISLLGVDCLTLLFV